MRCQRRVASTILQTFRFSSHLKLGLSRFGYFLTAGKLRSLWDFPASAGWGICAEGEGEEESRDTSWVG